MSSFTSSLSLVVAGFLPSLFWLSFYLKKDIHPEPRSLIARTFFLGLLLAPLAVFAQWIFREISLQYYPDFAVDSSTVFFLWAALVEEVVKFLAVKFLILHDPEFDEPVDAMIYAITASLGFAAIENILFLFSSISDGTSQTLVLWLYRFAGATLLHSLSGAIVGYFLALSWFYHHHSQKLIPIGIIAATLIHFLFNIIVTLSGERLPAFMYSLIFLLITASIIYPLFNDLKSRWSRLSSTPPSQG